MSTDLPELEQIPESEPWYCPECDFPAADWRALGSHLRGKCPGREAPVSPQVWRGFQESKSLLALWDSEDGYKKKISDRQYDRGGAARWKICADELRSALGVSLDA